MKLIPVIDLKGGQAVAARLGNRRHYAPLQSPLCRSSSLADVAAALLAHPRVDTLYIADLDAIEGGTGHLDLIAGLACAYPRIGLWVDDGLAATDRLAAFARPVIGSESLCSLDPLAELRRCLPRPILSLDYRGDRLVGPAELADRPDLWPEDVILMTLGRVGSDAGPDIERLARLRQLAPAHRIFAAGGVRDQADLDRLAGLGIAGALVSTALHRGTLPLGPPVG